jgi:hypothetical protein
MGEAKNALTARDANILATKRRDAISRQHKEELAGTGIMEGAFKEIRKAIDRGEYKCSFCVPNGFLHLCDAIASNLSEAGYRVAVNEFFVCDVKWE